MLKLIGKRSFVNEIHLAKILQYVQGFTCFEFNNDPNDWNDWYVSAFMHNEL